MAPVTISEGGEITIPEEIREEAGLAAGDKVILGFNDEGEIVIRKATGDIRDLRGIFKRPGQRPISVEEMNEAIGDAVAEKYQRVLNQSKKQS